MNLSFDVEKIRQDFPILSKKINNKSLIYFDNAATSQTPSCVIDCIKDYYEHYNSNIHRGVHSLSDEATNAYEDARNKVKDHFNIKYSEEVIFTSGTTHSINIVSNGFSKILAKDDDKVWWRAGWHQMGTCRMGNDPSNSVVNSWGRSHDVKNLFIVDGSIFVTAGAVNPTSTIQALALYIGDQIKNNIQTLFD